MLKAFFFLKKLFVVEIKLNYNVVSITAIQQSNSVIRIHTYIHTHIYIYIHTYIHTYLLFHILFHYGLSQDIEYSSLCYKVGSHVC